MTVAPAILWPPQRRAARPTTASGWIDVSNHQGLLSPSWFTFWGGRGYGGLVVQGVESLEGETFTRRQLWAAVDAGWQIAGYVWCSAGQARNLTALRRRLDFFNQFVLDFLALDIEEMGTTREDVEMSLQLCDAYQRAPAWIYTSKWVFDALRWSELSLWPERKLWTAKYDRIANVDVGFEPYGGWTRCEMKQFTDDQVDQNVRRV